jgi:hypothetical protein
MRRKSARFCASVRPALIVSWMMTMSLVRAMPR